MGPKVGVYDFRERLLLEQLHTLDLKSMYLLLL
jgi:hypothetical protein